MPNLVMYFPQSWMKNETAPLYDVYKSSPERLKTLKILIKKLSKKFRVYICCNRLGIDDRLIGKNTFTNIYEYHDIEDKCFFTKEVIVADIVFDRTDNSNLESFCNVIVNDGLFNKLTRDKWETYNFLPEYTPKSVLIKNNLDLNKAIQSINNRNQKIVLKSRYGLQGKNLFIDLPENLLNIEINKDYILQEFKDTSSGIPLIVGSTHDVRVFIANAEPILCFVRTPQKGMLVANTSQGGSVTYIDFDILPEYVIAKVRAIISRVYKIHPFAYYSIDFGIDKNNNFFVYELNSNMATPVFNNKIEYWAEKLTELINAKYLYSNKIDSF
jgi:glutathione synthase/RimK-type ligase-like ATP-grasp enzyme